MSIASVRGRGCGSQQALEFLVDLLLALTVCPADQRRGAFAAPMGQIKQGRESLLGGDAPEVSSLYRTLIELAGRRETMCHLECTVERRRPSVR
jgi:hypothetical protein